MIKTCLMGLTALATLALAASAQADWVRLGEVHVSHHRDRDTTYADFAAPIETLSFTARGTDMSCRSITADYGNGQRQQVFSGRLTKDRTVHADVRGAQRRIERLTMRCEASSPRGGMLQIAADVGRYRSAWEKTKSWAGRMASDIQHGMGLDGRDGWTVIGRERFSGRRDTENTFPGWRGRHVDRIGLRTVDDSARCRRVTATFENGRTRDLNINGGERLERGRVKVLDLPGNERNLRSVRLWCRATGDRDVTIEVLARR